MKTWLKENWFRIALIVFLILYLVVLRQHYRAECVAQLTSQDGISVDILRLSEACAALGYRS